MNYQRIHNLIIERAKNRVKLNGYTEDHHIIPRCMGGLDDKENLVSLTAREHFLIHYLLCKINIKSKSLIFAWWMMSQMKSGNQERILKINSRLYQISKEKMAKAISANMKGRKNNLGNNHTDESKKLMSKVHMGNKHNLGRVLTEEHKRKISKSLVGNKSAVGYKHSEQAKILISQSLKGNKNGLKKI